MLENGFIILHRKMINWEWYTDTNTKSVFLHLLLTANYEPKNFQGITIERGQRVASFQSLAVETGLTVKQVRTAVNHLKTSNEVASKSTNKFTVFTVVNYSLYQNKGQTDGQTKGNQKANEGQTKGNNETKITKINKDNNITRENIPTDEASVSVKSKKIIKHKYGEYQNVLLSDEDIEKLKAEIQNYEAYIEKLSSYMASTGKSYKNHLATIRNWARKDRAKSNFEQKEETPAFGFKRTEPTDEEWEQFMIQNVMKLPFKIGGK